MKERINNALNEIDERLIQEAAQADRLERSMPKILRRILIPAGVAAAAGLCVFALSNRPDNGENLAAASSGVDLIEPTSGVSVPQVIIPEKTEENFTMPDEIKLTAPSREHAEEIFFSSECLYPYFLYVYENRIVFTDGRWGMYVYDREQEKITFSTDFKDLADYAESSSGARAELVPEFYPSCGFFVIDNNGEILVTVGFRFTSDDTEYSYVIDIENGTVRRFEEFSELTGTEEIPDVYPPSRPIMEKRAPHLLDCMDIGENRYIGLELSDNDFEFSENGLRLIQFTEFSIEGDELTDPVEIYPFTEEYFDSLEMKDKNLGVYRLGDCLISFNTADSTYEMHELWLNSIPSGSYSVSGNELTLTDGMTGQQFRFTVDGDNLISAGGEQDKALYGYAYPDDNVKLSEIVFKLAYGKSAAGSGSAEVAEQVNIAAHELKTAEAEISEMLQKYHKQNEIIYDEAAARELEDNMLTSLTSVPGSVTAEDGYDDWRNGTHYGIDIGGEDMEGAEIYAPLDGTVAYVSDDNWNGGMGKHLILDHGSGLSTVYASLGEITVTEGQTVEQGEVIGIVGSTGFSTGAHLHFEIRRDSEISHEAMSKFVGRYTGETAGEPERYTVSIYEPESAAELISAMSCPLDDEYNAVAEVPGGYESHKGIDFLAPVGSNIYAAQSGEVVFADYNYHGYGKCVMIDHGSGVLTVYAHCSELAVTKGQTVAQGEVIGSTGSTGYTTGAQLHFEIRTDDTPDFAEMEKFMERIGSEIKPWESGVSETGETGETGETQTEQSGESVNAQ